METKEETNPAHFRGKDAVGHVAEKQAEGKISSAETHGTELPGHLSAGTDAARGTAVFLLLTWVALSQFETDPKSLLLTLATLGFGWIVWKSGRSAWLGWSRLERLHQALEQEKWEIEHNRPQEREELKVLYGAKGFEGQLLEDVVDVLMADGDRLLRVMVEEELGLSLETQDHPLRQGFGAFVGAMIAWGMFLLGLYLLPSYGPTIGAGLTLAIAAGCSAWYEQNRVVPAIIWNIGIATLAFSVVYFLIGQS